MSIAWHGDTTFTRKITLARLPPQANWSHIRAHKIYKVLFTVAVGREIACVVDRRERTVDGNNLAVFATREHSAEFREVGVELNVYTESDCDRARNVCIRERVWIVRKRYLNHR